MHRTLLPVISNTYSRANVTLPFFVFFLGRGETSLLQRKKAERRRKKRNTEMRAKKAMGMERQPKPEARSRNETPYSNSYRVCPEAAFFPGILNAFAPKLPSNEIKPSTSYTAQLYVCRSLSLPEIPIFTTGEYPKAKPYPCPITQPKKYLAKQRTGGEGSG